MDEERRARNLEVIEQFRAGGGRPPGEFFERQPLLLLHHVGAKSGAAYISPLAYLPDGDGRWVLFAANGARQNRPGWYYNLLANPETVIEVGTRTERVRSREVHGAERKAYFERQLRVTEVLGQFEQTKQREIPVLLLERIVE